MRKYLILFILILFLMVTGCTTYFSNLTAPKQILAQNGIATFDQDGYLVNVTVDHISIVSSSASPHVVTIHITVKNTGTKGVSLVAYPRISDDAGTEYAGNSIFLGAINPGGMASGESSITINADDANQFKDHGLLSIRFQNVKPMPWEATWYVYLNNPR
jgi:hypothetical protein